ncbi:hypothetical protein [Achromobacter sp.]|uniref:hypothetical protein n=1 Tax=Achromobacter sp. TaxID=134375 RepID=UPI003D00A489
MKNGIRRPVRGGALLPPFELHRRDRIGIVVERILERLGVGEVFAGLQAGSAELRRIDHIGTDAGRAVHVIGAAFFLVSALRLQAPSGFSSGWRRAVAAGADAPDRDEPVLGQALHDLVPLFKASRARRLLLKR